MDQELVGLVEDAARARRETPIPRKFIISTLQKIEAGEVEVERFPMGNPSLKSIFNIATKLYEKTTPKH